MCIDELNKNIERCQAQIAAIYDKPESEQDEVVLKGFQNALKKLLNERTEHNTRINNTPVYGARVVLPNGSEVCACTPAQTFKERSLQTHHFTIQQTKPYRP